MPHHGRRRPPGSRRDRQGSGLAEQAATGTIKAVITTVLPLDQAAEGLATIAAGQARGKIVIRISD